MSEVASLLLNTKGSSFPSVPRNFPQLVLRQYSDAWFRQIFRCSMAWFQNENSKGDKFGEYGGQ